MESRRSLTREERAAAIQAAFWIYLIEKHPEQVGVLELDPLPKRGKLAIQGVFMDASPAVTWAGPRGIYFAYNLINKRPLLGYVTERGSRWLASIPAEVRVLIEPAAPPYGSYYWRACNAEGFWWQTDVNRLWWHIDEVLAENKNCFKELFRRLVTGERLSVQDAVRVYRRKAREQASRKRAKERKAQPPAAEDSEGR